MLQLYKIVVTFRARYLFPEGFDGDLWSLLSIKRNALIIVGVTGGLGLKCLMENASIKMDFMRRINELCFVWSF